MVVVVSVRAAVLALIEHFYKILRPHKRIFSVCKQQIVGYHRIKSTLLVFFFVENLFHFFKKGVAVLKLSVNRRKSDVSNLVYLLSPSITSSPISLLEISDFSVL